MCHQTVSLVARHLEANGIPTVIMGCAKDIVEYCGVPRLLFSDFPLGNSAGRPFDAESQALTLELALRVLETAPAARTTVQSPLRWSEVRPGLSPLDFTLANVRARFQHLGDIFAPVLSRPQRLETAMQRLEKMIQRPK